MCICFKLNFLSYLLQCCVGIIYSETTMNSASGRTSSKKWWATGMAASIGQDTLVSAATIMTKHKPKEEDFFEIEEAEKKGEPVPKKRKTTTEAFTVTPLILLKPSDRMSKHWHMFRNIHSPSNKVQLGSLCFLWP